MWIKVNAKGTRNQRNNAVPSGVLSGIQFLGKCTKEAGAKSRIGEAKGLSIEDVFKNCENAESHEFGTGLEWMLRNIEASVVR